VRVLRRDDARYKLDRGVSILLAMTEETIAAEE
jgi:hypothetical protein